MTISEVTAFRAQATGVGTAASVTFAQTATVGQTIVVWLTYDSISAIAADPSGYSKVPPRTQTQGSCYLYYKTSVGTETSFAITIPAVVAWEMTATLWNGISSNPTGTDGDNGANSATATTTPTTGSLTPTTNGALVCGLIHHNNTGGTITSDGAGGWAHYPVQSQTGSSGYHAWVVQTTAAAITYQPTSGLSANYTGKIAAFKAAVRPPHTAQIRVVQQQLSVAQLAI
jgi:hypothetical protein